MTNEAGDRSPTDSERAAAVARVRAHWLRIVGFLTAGLALSAVVGIAAIRSPALLAVVSTMGSGGLTLDELQALGLEDKLKGPLVPVELGAVGWLAVLAPFGLLSYVGARLWLTDIRELYEMAMQPIFWGASALLGVSLALALHFRPQYHLHHNDATRLAFMAAAALGALCLHGRLLNDPLPTKAGKALLGGLLLFVFDNAVCALWASDVASLKLTVLGVVIFSALLAFDLSGVGQRFADAEAADDTRKLALFEALNLYVGLAGLILPFVNASAG